MSGTGGKWFIKRSGMSAGWWVADPQCPGRGDGGGCRCKLKPSWQEALSYTNRQIALAKREAAR